MITFIILRLVRAHDWIFQLWACAWAVLLACMITMQTQLIFGTARRNPQTLEYTIDMYAYVAFELYQHFFFFYVACTYCMGSQTLANMSTSYTCIRHTHS